MFDLSYRKVYNKQRRGERGPKKRYAVYRAEHNLRQEETYERLCRNHCEKHALNVDEIKVDAKLPWRMTWEYICIKNRYWPYRKLPVMRFWSQERKDTLDKNIEIANERTITNATSDG